MFRFCPLPGDFDGGMIFHRTGIAVCYHPVFSMIDGDLKRKNRRILFKVFFSAQKVY
jgi:hypothetical protein